MALDKLINETGPLLETFKRLDPTTIQHASEITNDRRDDKDLRMRWSWTADFLMYTVEDENGDLITGDKVKDGEVFLYVAGRENNLILKNIEESIGQLRENNNYHPAKDCIQSVIESVDSGDTSKIRLSDLELKERGGGQHYYEINTADYNSLNPSQRLIAEKIYGQGEDFKNNMEMMNKEGTSTIAIFVPGPGYVKEHIGRDGAVAQPSYILPSGINFDFHADDGSGVDFPSVVLRGMPKAAEKYKHACSCDKKDSCRIKLGNAYTPGKCCKDI